MGTQKSIKNLAKKVKKSPEITKEERVSAEIERLSAVFEDLDGNKRSVVEGLIRMAAFMTVSIEDLQKLIHIEGYTEIYDHGGGQKGRKQSAAVQMHIAMTRNLSTVMKQLLDQVPAERKKSKLAELRGMR